MQSRMILLLGMMLMIVTMSAKAQLKEGVSELDTVTVERDIVYGTVGERELRLDLLYPKQAQDTPFPVVVWIHGGAWITGSKDQNQAHWLAQHGFFTASVEYRLTGEAIWPAQIHDCKAAIRFLRTNAAKYNMDPNRIGVWGASAGGHLVAMLGTSGDVKEIEGAVGVPDVSSRVQAVVDYFGPSDLAVMGDFPSSMDHDAPDSPEAKLLGGVPKKMREKAREANPITYVTPDDPPFFIVHGDKDMTVPFNQSVILHQALVKAGVESEFVTVKGGGHGGWSDQTEPTNTEVRQMVLAFFERVLKK